MGFKTVCNLIFICLCFTSLCCVEHVYLKTPNISENEIIGTNVGVRPFRKSGVRIEFEELQNKNIIHNYGYGGSGLTLSFGGSKKVLELLNLKKITSKVVAVLGAGVIGLTTAYDLLDNGYEVHIYSEEWNSNLTSNVAAGIWTPLTFPSTMPEKSKKFHQHLLEVSEQRFLKSINNFPEFAGVKMMWRYKLAEGSHSLGQGEEVLIHFDNKAIKKGWRVKKLGIDGKVFMEDLYSKVKAKRAHLHQKQFKNRNDVLNLKEDVVINCMSMAAREIFNDQEFIPVQGQLVYLRPQLEVGKETLVVNPNTIKKMIQNASKSLSYEP